MTARERERERGGASSVDVGASAAESGSGEVDRQLVWLGGAVVSSAGAVHGWTWKQGLSSSSSNAETCSDVEEPVVSEHLSGVQWSSDAAMKLMWESMQKKEYGGDFSRENRKRGRNDKKLQADNEDEDTHA